MSPPLICSNERRRDLVRKASLNGLDYLEVDDTQLKLTVFFLGKAPAALAEMSSDELKKHVHITGGTRIRDIRVTDVRFQLYENDPERDDFMTVTVDKFGDFSTYTLKLVADCLDKGQRKLRPYPGFDPRYAELEFNFKAGCPSDLDCKQATICRAEPRNEPEISYLAKDYSSFRQLILDRLALVMPEWKERHEADVGITLVELLAYVGDYLSYHQDAVATEAYLGTARQRISVRRHAQLVDYQLHEGCNARAWVYIELDGKSSEELDPDGFYLTTSFPGAPEFGQPLHDDDLRSVPTDDYLTFETLIATIHKSQNSTETPQRIQLFEAHNCIHIYTWGDAECCLPKGATSATLTDSWTGPAPTVATATSAGQKHPYCHAGDEHLLLCEMPDPRPRKLHLSAGDFVLFEEVVGPKTGNPNDADRRHRHVVRITSVKKTIDELCNLPVLEITWGEEDALPFPLCVSTLGPPAACQRLENISIARGNIVMVDHGRTISYEPLGSVPIQEHVVTCEGENRPSDISNIPGRFRPALRHGPLTFSEMSSFGASASKAIRQNPSDALPCVWLKSTPATSDGRSLYTPDDIADPTQLIQSLRVCDQALAKNLSGMISFDCRELLAKQSKQAPVTGHDKAQMALELERLSIGWSARRLLLDSQAADPHFVVENDNQGHVHLRFGDAELGRKPAGGSQFKAQYRVGNGPAGNVGADAIRHIVFRKTLVSGVAFKPRNPLSATGGTAPESLEEARQFAPQAYRRRLRRAITADDYATILQRDFPGRIQRAAATLRWTGSSFEVLVAVDLFNQFRDLHQTSSLMAEFQDHLYAYRGIGHDIAVEPAEHVPLEIEMTVCVLRDYLRGDVKDALLTVFSSRINPEGTRGFFHADNLSFGDGVSGSRLIATAQAVTGVENVVVKKMHRKFEGPNGEVESGLLPLRPLEVARLDNDANFPENGTIRFEMRGGR